MKLLRLAAATAAATLLLAACGDTGSITEPAQPNVAAPRLNTDAVSDSTMRENGGMFGSGGRVTSGSADGGGMAGSGGRSDAEVMDGGGMIGGGS